MRITLAQLEAIVWVDRLGSVSAAAVQLNLTQSSVSLRLKELREALGRPLFSKQGRRLVLNDDGRSVLDHATTIIEHVELLYDRSRPERITGSIRFGIVEALSVAALPGIISELETRYPALRVEMTVGTSIDLERQLLAGALDVVIGINLHDDPRLRLSELGVQTAAWYAPPDSELPAIVRPRDLARFTVLSNPGPSPMYQQTMNWFRSEKLTPRQISVSFSIIIIAHLVAAGSGVAILPTKLVETTFPKGALLRLMSEQGIDESRMFAAHRADDWRPAINAVVEVTRERVQELDWLVAPT
ncbi:LysR family transcriptional regulator [Devosia sp. YIM 151766]|uniref:LysR family transcriptional regulator n=1 Tax=Devosia sp. YIM 151766 TaxID=3017325 RepID=UPI00255C45D9|nr:LysR family transcriptional regulator [Devosia sp. YIM 151766]WIY52388.1 LysR family transcriptional regulator [Devosia sp. YIM 151766]